MHFDLLARGSVLLVCLLVTASQACAYSFIDNRGLFPIGEIESFMANSGSAMSGSTGAVYYNPAGLASIRTPHISLSANTYLSTHTEIKPFQVFDDVEMNYKTEGFQAIPSAFVSTGLLGNWRYALSVLIPHQLKVQDAVKYATPNYPDYQYWRTNQFSLLMIGPSVATTLASGFDIGAGCFYSMYSTTQSQSSVAQKMSGNNSLVITSYFDAQVSGLTCNAGLQKQATENLRWGFTARLPLMITSKKATASRFLQRPSDGASGMEGPKSVDPDYQVPPDFTFGLEATASSLIKFYLDLSYQLGTSFKSGDIDVAAATYRPTPRGSLGARLSLTPAIDLFGGVTYNPSSVTTDNENSGEDFLMGTVGGRWAGANSNMGLGALFGQSKGTFRAPVADATPVVTGTRDASLATSVFGILLSSGYTF